MEYWTEGLALPFPAFSSAMVGLNLLRRDGQLVLQS